MPALSGYQLHPALVVKANGTTDRLSMDLDMKSEAGLVRGQLVTDLRAPDFRVRGSAPCRAIEPRADSEEIPSSRATSPATSRVDVKFLSGPEGAPALDRLGGTFTFSGPRVTAFGYAASDVRANGSFKGPRIVLSAANVRAYRRRGDDPRSDRPAQSAAGRSRYDLRGTATNVDLRRLPTSVRAPQLDTCCRSPTTTSRAVARALSGSATSISLRSKGRRLPRTPSSNSTPVAQRPLSYAARGTLHGMDVRRLGKALEIAALDDRSL